MKRLLALVLVLPLLGGMAWGQTREEKVRNDRKKVEGEGFWIYNDLAKGLREAKESGKPLIVVLRCLPCEECVKLDDELIDQHPSVKPLLGKFVRVRQISTNGLDLATFQYDYDQSFAVFFLNGDGTVYGRFGTRSHRTDWHDDVSIEGLGRAMAGALELHQGYPGNKALVEAKRGPAPEVASPEKFPNLQGKFTAQLDYQGQVVKSCIHCHQVGESQKEWHRDRAKTIPDHVLFPYPHPKSLGLIFDPREKSTVEKIEPGTLAAKSGFQAGDVIRQLSGQTLLSIADVQWVLQGVPAEGGVIDAVVQRDGAEKRLTWTLPAGWRRLDDIAWRASSWTLRRWGTGGIYSEALSEEERKGLDIPANRMVLRVKHVGQYAPHYIAHRAGVQKGDLIVAFDGRRDFLRESDLLAYGVNEARGKEVAVELLRDGKPVATRMTLPK